MCPEASTEKRPPYHVLGPSLSALSHRYVYDHIGGEHSAVIPELVASVATFAVTTLWLGPCDIVYLWSVLNCFGLNFELWVQKLAEWEPLARIEVSPGSGAPLLSEGVQPHAVPRTLTTTLLVLRRMAHPGGIWPSLPSVGHGTPRPGYIGQVPPSLQTSVSPSLTMRESDLGLSETQAYPQDLSDHVNKASDHRVLFPLGLLWH